MITNLGPELTQAADAMIRDVLLVQSGETVLITADTASDMQTVEAIQNAARSLDTPVALLISSATPLSGRAGRPLYFRPGPGCSYELRCMDRLGLPLYGRLECV